MGRCCLPTNFGSLVICTEPNERVMRPYRAPLNTQATCCCIRCALIIQCPRWFVFGVPSRCKPRVS